MKIPKISKLDIIIGSVLVFLIFVELVMKRDELFHESPVLLVLGVVLGFSIGFKLTSLHAGSVHRNLMGMVKDESSEKNLIKKDLSLNLQKLKADIDLRDKRIQQLNNALLDRDGEIKELVVHLEKYREKFGNL